MKVVNDQKQDVHNDSNAAQMKQLDELALQKQQQQQQRASGQHTENDKVQISDKQVTYCHTCVHRISLTAACIMTPCYSIKIDASIFCCNQGWPS